MTSASSTMLFGDCGTRAQETTPPVNHSAILMYSASVWVTPGEPGTMDAIFESGWQTPKMPLAANDGDRHSDTLNIAFADGHGANTNESTWDQVYLSPHE